LRDDALARVRWQTALLLLGCACLNLYALGGGSLWDQDETKYAEIAQEIVRTGDPITLHSNGEPWYVHPPLYMWLVAGTGRALGFGEFSVRIWSTLFSLLAIYATVLLGSILFDARVGLLAGAVLGVTLQYLFQSRLAVFDTVLLAWMLLAFYAFYRAYRLRRRADYLRFFLFAGLGTLTKGPIGLVLPGLVAAIFMALRGAGARWRDVPWAVGGTLYAAVGLSWYVLQAALHGQAFVRSVFGTYMLGRFFGIVENQANPWWLYFPVVLLGGFPWTSFWPAAARFHWVRRAADGSLLVMLWCAVTFVFYSLAGTKLPNYILPIYPFAAIGVAALWAPALDRRHVGRALGVSLLLLLALVAALFAGVAGYVGGNFPVQYHALGHVLVAPATALIAGVGIALVLAARGEAMPAFVALCLTVAVLWLGVVRGMLPLVETQKPMKPLALAIRSALAPGDRIIGYRMDVHASLPFYTAHDVQWVETPEALRAAICLPGRVFLIGFAGDLASLSGKLPPAVHAFASRDDTTVLIKPASARCG
jgi:4-amino-4-deoxy-L-arabinose transferase-like glycosyltransferase